MIVLQVNFQGQEFLAKSRYLSFFVAACSLGLDLPEKTTITTSETTAPEAAIIEESSGNLSPGIAEPTTTLKPEPAHPSEIPGYHQSIPLDGIRPVYNPQFATSDKVATLMFDDELVMGVAWDGEAKAYPVTVLRFREIVNDELAGIPTLVTW
jgi:hypothetical protein